MVEISVIVPVYNVEKYLRDTLECLKNEEFRSVEFILVDDGSDDASPAICDEFAELDDRFKVIHQRNGGPARARNAGLDAAKGRWVCFVDSDDLLRPGSLQRMYDMAQGYDVLIHSAEFIGDGDAAGDWIKDAIKVKDAAVDDFSIGDVFSRRGCGPVLWLHFIRADLIQRDGLRIDEDLFLGEDYSFAVAYLANARKVRFTSEPFYRYRVSRPGSLITTYRDRSPERMEQGFIMCKAMYKSIAWRIKPSDEVPMIRALVVFMFHDFHKLEYKDMLRFSAISLKYLKHLHLDSHLYELEGSVLSMIAFIKGIDDKSITLDTKTNMTSREYWNMFSD